MTHAEKRQAVHAAQVHPMTPEQLKSIRERLGLTQAQLAQRMGVERNTINRWEMGLNRIPRMAQLLLAQLTGRRI